MIPKEVNNVDKKVKDLTVYNNRFAEDPASFNDYQAADYVRELKNQGKEDEAIDVGRTFMEVAPHLKGYINYYGYALYNRYINIPEEKINEKEHIFYEILDEIAKVCKQERYSPLEAAVNKAIKHVTKQTPVDYQKMSDLLDYLDAPTLEETPFVNKDGKEFESKKEKWYRMKIRALYEIGDYKACLERANEALALPITWHYFNLNWVKYYRGSALVALGEYQEGENEFLALKDNFRAVDFTQVMYKLYKNTDRESEANIYVLYEFFLSGCNYRSMNLYKLVLDIVTEKEQTNAIKYGKVFIAKMEEEQGNTVDTDVDLSEFDGYSADQMFDKFYREVMNNLSLYVDRKEGRVVYYNEEKQYGSIADTNNQDRDRRNNVFFRQADFIDDEKVERRDYVEYSVVKTYDRRRQQPSTKAVLLRTIDHDDFYFGY